VFYRMRLFTLLVLLILFGTAHARNLLSGKDPAVEICNHGGYELWDNMRMLPVHFTQFDSNIASWKYQDDYVVELGAFSLNTNTQYISREKKRVDVLYFMARKGTDWLCYYCSHCHALLRAYELKAGSSSLD
jgi:hypothetical protein